MTEKLLSKHWSVHSKHGGPAAALELEDGRIITGKTSNLLGASAALLVNVLKELAGIDHECPYHLSGSNRTDPEIESGLPEQQEPSSSHRRRS